MHFVFFYPDSHPLRFGKDQHDLSCHEVTWMYTNTAVPSRVTSLSTHAEPGFFVARGYIRL